jgi:actin-related protein 9
MFPGEKGGEWEPNKVREKAPKPKQPPAEGEERPEEEEEGEPEIEYYEDFQSEADALWPIRGGKIVNWSAFFALLAYVHKRLSPHLHSPVLLVAQPCWTVKDYERITQFYFETFKPPGFVIVDSALTSLWAYNVVNACVVDVGYEKTDVSAIVDFAINTPGRGIAIPGLGGEGFTQTLLGLLQAKGFDQDMCEQLKKSSICEILPADIPLPGGSDNKTIEITNPAAAASTGAIGSGPGQRITAGALGDAPLGPGPGTEVGEDGLENDGVLDVASIVAGGNKKMEEFLAKKEKEKQEKANKKARDAAALAASKPIKLRNAEKDRATFTYEEIKPVEPEANGTANGESNPESSGKPHAVVKRTLEVGVERFQVASSGVIEKIADAIYLAISSVDDIAKRSEVWDHLIVVGNGSRIKGLSSPKTTFNTYHC